MLGGVSCVPAGCAHLHLRVAHTLVRGSWHKTLIAKTGRFPHHSGVALAAWRCPCHKQEPLCRVRSRARSPRLLLLCALTIRSSRCRFAARLNSGVRSRSFSYAATTQAQFIASFVRVASTSGGFGVAKVTARALKRSFPALAFASRAKVKAAHLNRQAETCRLT